MLRRSILLGALAVLAFAQENADWIKPFPPFRIVGNIYWVGTWDLSTYLITTPRGNILINAGLVPLSLRSRRAWNNSVSVSPIRRF